MKTIKKTRTATKETTKHVLDYSEIIDMIESFLDADIDESEISHLTINGVSHSKIDSLIIEYHFKTTVEHEEETL